MKYVLIIIIWHGLDAPIATAEFDDLASCETAKTAIIGNVKSQNEYLSPFAECFLHGRGSGD